MMRYVDHGEPDLERLDAERRAEARRAPSTAGLEPGTPVGVAR